MSSGNSESRIRVDPILAARNLASRTTNLTTSLVGRLSSLLTAPIHLPGLARPGEKHPLPKPGSAPGIEQYTDVNTPPATGAIPITVIDYGPDKVQTTTIDDLQSLFAMPRPDFAAVRWINVDGLHPYVIEQFRKNYNFHPLAAEDVLHTPQRPKIEPYADYTFLVTTMIMLRSDRLHSEQVSMFLCNNTLITFQETIGDVWQPLRERINNPAARIRSSDVGFLLYALLDALVDHCFPILEHFGDLLEDIEDDIAQNPTPHLLHHLHAIKRQLVLIRRVTWPTRDLIDHLYRDETSPLSPAARTYMRDVHDHLMQLIDIIETYRELSAGLTDLYMSAVSNRMNDVMKVLTIIATIFIPITFLAGVYGMNFHKNFPELDWAWSYPAFWIVCVILSAGMLFFFYRRGWLSKWS